MILELPQVALCDRSNWGLLQLTGDDRLRFLHNQSTNNILALAPGKNCDTVFVNSTGRTLDLATVYITSDAILILVSPNRRQFLLEWMDRYIFPMDKVELKDLSEQYTILSLIGPESPPILQQLGLKDLPNSQEHQLVNLENTQVLLANGCGLALPGYTLIIPTNQSQTIKNAILNQGINLLNESDWEQLRILQGRPAPDQELTEDYNPLEAGLWQAISFNKGCYIGQETIARLNTYKGVKQRLWGVHLAKKVAPGTLVSVEDKKAGILTSCTETPSGFFGLAYIRTQMGGEGLQVKIGDTTGEIIAVPFLTHEYYRGELSEE